MSLTRQVAALAGQPVSQLERLHGGDLSDVWRATLNDGTTLVAKTGPRVDTEARMLGALRHAGAPAPCVLGEGDGLVLLEDLPEGPASDAAWAGLGRVLRHLHTTTGPIYGWTEDYAFGPVGIPNAARETWPTFWAENRLMAAPEALPVDIARRVEALAQRLPDLLPTTPPAALLHGDLWSGNVHMSGDCAYLIDPACYYGDAEVDLAMLALFGAPPRAFDESYGALEPGYEQRRPLYQLWPALVHLRLFGAGYRGMVNRLLERLNA